MRRSALLISCLAVGLSLTAKSNEPVLTGSIKGFENDTVYVRFIKLSDPGSRNMDTLKASKDCFTYSREITEPMEFTIYSTRSFLKRANGRLYLPETRMIKAVLKPGEKISIQGSMDARLLKYEAKGSDFNQTFALRRNQMLEDKAELVRRELNIDSLAYNNMDEKVIDMLDTELELKRLESQKADIEFIRKNPANDLSAYYLNALPMDTFLIYVAKLAPAVRKGIFAKGLDIQEEQSLKFKAVQEAQARVAEGTQAPDFTLKSIRGENVSLSSFKGKYIVLDFWGAWCYWCMKGVPQMKEYYEKYKDKVEFIGIDVRDKEDVWKSTVEKQGMNWVHLQNLTPTDVPVVYGVSGYPTKLILDKDLKIVARIIGESPEFYKKLDELLK